MFEAGEVRHTDIARAVVRKCVFTLTDCWKQETGHAGRTHGEGPGLIRRQREAGEDGIPGQESSSGFCIKASQVVLVVKNPPASAGDGRDMGSTVGWEDPLEEGMAIHSSILAWRIP